MSSRMKSFVVVASCASVIVISVTVYAFVKNRKERSSSDADLKSLLSGRADLSEDEDLEEADE